MLGSVFGRTPPASSEHCNPTKEEWMPDFVKHEKLQFDQSRNVLIVGLAEVEFRFQLTKEAFGITTQAQTEHVVV